MKYILIILVFLIFLSILESIRESRHFKTTKYHIITDKLTQSEQELKIIMLADLHNYSYGENNSRLIQAIHEESPDVIMAAGDLLVAKPGKDMTTAENLIKELAASYPVYYGNGNHEYRLKIYPEDYGSMYEQYKRTLKKAEVHLLENEHTRIPFRSEKINVYGLEIEREYYKRFKKQRLPEGYIQEKLGQADPDAYNILIAHNPAFFEAYKNWGADMVLSGHLHGGMVRLPFIGGVISPQVQLFPRYSGGLYQKDKSHLVLSRGLGAHTIHFRLFNTPELISIILEGK